MTDRVQKTTLGTLIGIKEAIENINVDEQEVKSIVQKQMSAELPGMLKIYLDNNIGKITVEEQKVRSIVHDQMSVELPRMVDTYLRDKLPEQQNKEDPIVDINYIIIGWLLFNFYSSLKEHSDSSEITGLANKFAAKFSTTDGQQLRHLPFIQDIDALTEIIDVINNTVPMFLKAYREATNE